METLACWRGFSFGGLSSQGGSWGKVMRNWLFLFLAIGTEVLGTSALKASDGFSKLWPSLLVVLAYACSFYFLSLTLRAIPVGVAYAIWSGLGIVLIALAAKLLFGQKLDFAALVGIGFIVAGVVIMGLFSKTGGH